MSSSNLIRWSGLAAVAGGVLIVISDVLNAVLYPSEPGSEAMLTSTWFIVQMLVFSLFFAHFSARIAARTPWFRA